MGGIIQDRIVPPILLPLLLAQGLWVRQRVRRMPEPPGPRSGTTGNGPPLRLLVLGDSAAAGVGATTQQQALLGRLTTRLAQQVTIKFELMAQIGARTQDALRWLDRLPSDSYDVVVISLGVNDVTKAVPLSRWLQYQAELLDRLSQDFAARRIVITGLPPMHRYTMLPQPLRWVIGRRATRFSVAITDVIAKRANCVRIDGDPSLVPSLMAEDGFHPGPDMHDIWADLAADAILADPQLLDACQSTA